MSGVTECEGRIHNEGNQAIKQNAEMANWVINSTSWPDSSARIVGGPVVYINGGSPLTLTCLINQTPGPADHIWHIFWHHNGEVCFYSGLPSDPRLHPFIRCLVLLSVHTGFLFSPFSLTRIRKSDCWADFADADDVNVICSIFAGHQLRSGSGSHWDRKGCSNNIKINHWKGSSQRFRQAFPLFPFSVLSLIARTDRDDDRSMIVQQEPLIGCLPPAAVFTMTPLHSALDWLWWM